MGAVLSGGIAGLVVTYVISPFELIKCRLQVCKQMDVWMGKSMGYLCVAYREQVQSTDKGTGFYKGPVDCLIKVRHSLYHCVHARERGALRA